MTLPSETQPPSPQREPSIVQSQPLDQVVSELQIRTEQVVQDLSVVEISYDLELSLNRSLLTSFTLKYL